MGWGQAKSSSGLRSGVEDILAQIEWAAVVVSAAIGLFIAVLSLSSFFEGATSAEGIARFLRAFAIGFSLAVASSAVGCILGFLFGIPKLLQKGGTGVEGKSSIGPVDGASDRPERFFMTNTSFEEISDWLTKIIIGLGLVQFFNIVKFIRACATVSAAYVTGDKIDISDIDHFPNIGAVAFFFCIIVACLVLSCLFAYLETRTRITLLFLGMEQGLMQPLETHFESALSRSIVEFPRPDFSQGSARVPAAELPTKPLTEVDEAILKYPRERLKTGVQLGGWASVQGRAGHLQVSEDGLRDALQKDPENIQLMARLAEIRRAKKNPSAFVEIVIETMKRAPRDKEVISLAKDAQFEALYLPSPFGFEKAIELSRLLINAGEDSNAFVQLRYACALGQQYKFLQRRGGTDASIDQVRTDALDAVRRVVQIEPNVDSPVRIELKRLFVPSSGKIASEDDLEVFLDDEDFKNLIDP